MVAVVWAKPWLRWSLGAALFGALFLHSDPAATMHALVGADWAVALPAVIGLVLVHLLGAMTWKLLTSTVSGVELTWGYAYRSYYASQLIGGVTPGNLGSDAFRVLALRGTEGQWPGVVLPVAIQRLTSYLVVLAFGLVALLLLPLDGRLVDYAWIAVVALLVVCIGGVGVLLLFQRTIYSVAERRISIAAWVGPLRTSAAGRGVATGLLMALAFHAAAIGLSFALVVSMRPDAPVAETLAALAFARLVMMLPISPGGLGFQEGALVLLFSQIGLTGQLALSVSLLSRLALLGTMAVGLITIVSGTLDRTVISRNSYRTG